MSGGRAIDDVSTIVVRRSRALVSAALCCLFAACSSADPDTANSPAPVAATPGIAVSSGSGEAAEFVMQGCPAELDDSNVRCFFDRDGGLHHWVRGFDVTEYSSDFWGNAKATAARRYVVAFAYIRDRQSAYNDWVEAHKPNNFGSYGRTVLAGSDVCIEGVEPSLGCGGTYDYGSAAFVVPYRIVPNGRLTLQTILIPYYESSYDDDRSLTHFVAACRRLEGDDRPYPCRGFVEETQPSGRAPGYANIPTVPDYRDARLAPWDAALHELARARTALFEQIVAVLRDPQAKSSGRIECLDIPFDQEMRCAFELDAMPAELLARLVASTQAIADATRQVQAMEAAYATRSDALE
jgi:hypothetical protein